MHHLKTTISRFVLCVLLLAVVSNVTSAIPASLTFADDFRPGPGQSAASASLAGRDIGGEQWRIDGSVTIDAAGGRITVSQGSGAAWFPVEPGAKSATLSATLNPSGTDWTALALGGRWGSAFYDTAQLWLLMRPSADYQIRANGQKLVLKTGKVPGFRRAEGNRVELICDTAARTLTVKINGSPVLENHVLPDGFTPALDSAGIRFNGPLLPNAAHWVSGFSLTVGGDFPVRLALRLDDDLGVYAPGSAPVPKIVARGLPGDTARLSLSVVDFTQKTVWSSETAQPLVGGSFTLAPRLQNLPTEQGWFELRAETRDATGRVLAQAGKAFAIVPAPPSAALTDANPFGAMVYPHIAYSTREKELDARYMQRIGLRYVRTHRLNWVHIQQKAGAPLRWADADREVDIYRRHGLRIIATTGWPVPSWASSARDLDLPDSKGNFAPAPDAMDDARRFHRELAARYRDDIAYYEIGNEVDAHFWLGSAEHYREHDIPGILRDYRDYFAALSTEIRSSAPDARVAPGVTGAKEGHTYRPWLTSQMELGLGELMTAYGPHYRSDIGYANEVMASHGVRVPVIFTEIGGFSRNPGGSDPFGSEIRRVICEDYRQMATQLTHANVRALCKFILREQPTYGGEGVIHAGLLGADFSLRPSYVAYATLVRSLAGAKFVGRLNLTRSSTAGWGEGFAFERDGRRINFLFLHAAAPASLNLRSPMEVLTVVDVMGNPSRLPVINGRAELPMSPDLPLIIVGSIEGEPGPVEIPQDTLIRETVLTLQNPEFEQSTSGPGVPGWGIMANEQSGGATNERNRFTVSIDRNVRHGGAQSVRMDAPRPTRWHGITQSLPMGQIPRPGPGEYIVFKISVQAKGESIHGKGLGYTLALRRPNGERLVFLGSPYFGFGGTYDWKELAGENRLDVWPEGAERVTLDLLLGLSTGRLWVDDVKVTVQLWRKP